jgi:twitching motility protein PilT
MDVLLGLLVRSGGSDLHLSVGVPPTIRVDGVLRHVPNVPVLGPDDTENLARQVVSDHQWHRFQRDRELDTGYAINGLARFRVNVYRQRGTVGAAFRAIPARIPTMAELGLPLSLEGLAQLPRGLVLVTGPTGSGKSTTLAAMIDAANKTRQSHIVTIEDPIEYEHAHQRSLVNQREVGPDTTDFSSALKHVLRQDPDIIMVGEMRDLETTSMAITAAETGHLVLATLHTRSAVQSIDRLLDIYPQAQQPQIRAQLASCLQAVVAQTLVPRRSGGRAVVCEVMLATPAIRALIRESKVHLIPSYVQAGSDAGMLSFDQHLAERYRDGIVSRHTALSLAQDQAEFSRLAGLV